MAPPPRRRPLRLLRLLAPLLGSLSAQQGLVLGLRPDASALAAFADVAAAGAELDFGGEFGVDGGDDEGLLRQSSLAALASRRIPAASVAGPKVAKATKSSAKSAKSSAKLRKAKKVAVVSPRSPLAQLSPLATEEEQAQMQELPLPVKQRKTGGVAKKLKPGQPLVKGHCDDFHPLGFWLQGKSWKLSSAPRDLRIMSLQFRFSCAMRPVGPFGHLQPVFEFGPPETSTQDSTGLTTVCTNLTFQARVDNTFASVSGLLAPGALRFFPTTKAQDVAASASASELASSGRCRFTSSDNFRESLAWDIVEKDINQHSPFGKAKLARDSSPIVVTELTSPRSPISPALSHHPWRLSAGSVSGWHILNKPWIFTCRLSADEDRVCDFRLESYENTRTVPPPRRALCTSLRQRQPTELVGNLVVSNLFPVFFDEQVVRRFERKRVETTALCRLTSEDGFASSFKLELLTMVAGRITNRAVEVFGSNKDSARSAPAPAPPEPVLLMPRLAGERTSTPSTPIAGSPVAGLSASVVPLPLAPISPVSAESLAATLPRLPPPRAFAGGAAPVGWRGSEGGGARGGGGGGGGGGDGLGLWGEFDADVLGGAPLVSELDLSRWLDDFFAPPPATAPPSPLPATRLMGQPPSAFSPPAMLKAVPAAPLTAPSMAPSAPSSKSPSAFTPIGAPSAAEAAPAHSPAPAAAAAPGSQAPAAAAPAS